MTQQSAYPLSNRVIFGRLNLEPKFFRELLSTTLVRLHLVVCMCQNLIAK